MQYTMKSDTIFSEIVQSLEESKLVVTQSTDTVNRELEVIIDIYEVNSSKN